MRLPSVYALGVLWLLGILAVPPAVRAFDPGGDPCKRFESPDIKNMPTDQQLTQSDRDELLDEADWTFRDLARFRGLPVKGNVAKAFKDKRLKIEIADAFEYLGRKQSKARFDLIVGDRPDPIGPGKALFGETFYDRIKRALKPGGFATFQTGVPFYQPREIAEALAELAACFPQSGLYLTVVPTYIGGFMALSWAGKGARLGTPAGLKRAAAAYKKSKLKTDYYNPAVHAAAFALPEWIERLVP